MPEHNDTEDLDLFIPIHNRIVEIEQRLNAKEKADPEGVAAIDHIVIADIKETIQHVCAVLVHAAIHEIPPQPQEVHDFLVKYGANMGAVQWQNGFLVGLVFAQDYGLPGVATSHSGASGQRTPSLDGKSD